MHNALYPTVIPPWYYSNLSMPMPSRAATLSSLSTMAADAPIEAFVLGLPPLLGTCCDVDLAVRLDFCFGLRRCLGLALGLRVLVPLAPRRGTRVLRPPLVVRLFLTGVAQ